MRGSAFVSARLYRHYRENDLGRMQRLSRLNATETIKHTGNRAVAEYILLVKVL